MTVSNVDTCSVGSSSLISDKESKEPDCSRMIYTKQSSSTMSSREQDEEQDNDENPIPVNTTSSSHDHLSSSLSLLDGLTPSTTMNRNKNTTYSTCTSKNQKEEALPIIKQVEANECNEIQIPNSNNVKKHCWSQPGGQIYQVRGKKYMSDRVKVDSLEQIFRTRGVDFFLTEEFGPPSIGR